MNIIHIVIDTKSHGKVIRDRVHVPNHATCVKQSSLASAYAHLPVFVTSPQ
jgi:hypothetical protein